MLLQVGEINEKSRKNNHNLTFNTHVFGVGIFNIYLVCHFCSHRADIMAKVNFKIEGMDKLIKSLNTLGKVPQKHVTSSARKGMNIPLKQARANAPYDTGALSKGMKLKGERSRVKGKKVYQVVFDDKMNDVFQKKNKKGEITGYYPVSQEYGFFARNGKYIPGFRFVSDSLIDNVGKIEKTIVSEMKQKIDAEIAKEGLK